jgi:DNA-binding transcriptional ArsR family regulator
MSSRPKDAFSPACWSLTLSAEEEKRLLSLFKAASNPIRFRIMKFLLTHPGSITGDIVEHLPIAQATTSQHLKVLREAGLIEGTVEGPAVNYRLKEETIRWFRGIIAHKF